MKTIMILLGFGLMISFIIQPVKLKAQEDTFRWAGSMGQGQVLDVKGISGSIRARLAQGDRAEIVAHKRGDSGDFGEVAVEMVETTDGIVVCAVYGSWNHGKGRCGDGGQSDSDLNRHRNVSIDVEVDYEVMVPAGVALEASTVAGEVRAEGLRSDVEASSVDGSVRISTTGRARGNTVSGDLEIEMGNPGTKDLAFSTISGDITLWLPSDFGATIEFQSLSGDFYTDFDLAVHRQRGRWVGTSLEGAIGGGGRLLSLETVSGDVEVRKRQG